MQTMILIRRIAGSLLAFCVALLAADLALITLGASGWWLYGVGLVLTVPTVAYVVSSANGRPRRAPDTHEKRHGRRRFPGPIH
jgi:hypothetical protein